MKSLLRSLSLLAVLALSALSLSAPAADLSITAANFQLGANAKKEIGKAGAVLSVGQLIYLDSASQTWKLADANLSADAATVAAIVVTDAKAIGNSFIYCYGDADLTLGATLSMTAPVYCLSATAGAICPVADLSTGYYPAVVLVAKSTTKCVFMPTVLRGPAAMSAVFDLGSAPFLALVPPPVLFTPSAYDRPRRVALAPVAHRITSQRHPWQRGYAPLAA